jgi:hypothetical protein
MKLIFVKDTICSFGLLAEPIVDDFAKNKDMQLIKYIRTDEKTPKIYDINISPVLFFVENDNILGKVEGYRGNEQLKAYQNELKYIYNPLLRPVFKERKEE